LISLYAQYVREREGREIIEYPEGFVTYSFEGENCYIQDVFVTKDHRRKNICFDLGDRVSRIAKEKGCKALLGSVVPTAKGSTESLKMLIAYGFMIYSSTNNFILLKKELV
jgi:hypothetical protein